MAYFMDSLYLK